MYLDTVVYTNINSLYKDTGRNCLVLQVLPFMVSIIHLNMIARGFNDYIKGIFKALYIFQP